MLESKQLSLTCPQFSIFRHEFLSCMLNDPSFYLQELTNMLENVSFDNYSCQLFIWSYQDDQIVWDFQNKSHIKNWRIYLEISHFLNKTLLLLLFFPYFFPMFLTMIKKNNQKSHSSNKPLCFFFGCCFFFFQKFHIFDPHNESFDY